ncbi:MAG TPA: hypothetical protein VK901_21100 [Nitrospiraceae bacterium]|nr:hypothetical protein [Nitrospiraceae bacterium]
MSLQSIDQLGSNILWMGVTESLENAWEDSKPFQQMVGDRLTQCDTIVELAKVV